MVQACEEEIKGKQKSKAKEQGSQGVWTKWDLLKSCSVCPSSCQLICTHGAEKGATVKALWSKGDTDNCPGVKHIYLKNGMGGTMIRCSRLLLVH